MTAYVAYVAAVNPKGTRMLLANGLRFFTIKGKPDFINSPKRLPADHPNCTIFDNGINESFISVLEPSPKAFLIFENCLLVNNNLYYSTNLNSLIIFCLCSGDIFLSFAISVSLLNVSRVLPGDAFVTFVLLLANLFSGSLQRIY